jgi:hypothetical protein
MGIRPRAPAPSPIMSTYFVFLRRPRTLADRRNDPFWEFGSFGRTGCHSRNLLHAQHTRLRAGDRLAFLQGGPGEIRIVAVTPPMKIRRQGNAVEATWDPHYRPLRFSDAPLLIDNHGHTDVPGVLPLLRSVRRSTYCGKAASRFRSLTRPIAPELARRIRSRHDARWRAVATRYVDAVGPDGGPWHIHALACRWHVRSERYEQFLRAGANRGAPTAGVRSKCLTRRKPSPSPRRC